MQLISRRLGQILGLLSGFVLIDYGFNLISVGIPGARAFTSQFLAVNFLIGGSALVFISLYYLLRPVVPAAAPAPASTPVGPAPDVSVETVVEENTPPKPGFYKTIEYIGYFFTVLGLISAADLVLQVFIRSTYYEGRWWVEVLLVIFGVLSYTIFGSVGRLGMQEEAKLRSVPTTPQLSTPAAAEMPVQAVAVAATEEVAPLGLILSEFTQNPEGEFEKHLSGESYDVFRVEPDLVTAWRENRRGIRSTYIAGPYELTKKMLEEFMSSGQELRVGDLSLSCDTIRGLVGLMERSKRVQASVNASAQPEV